MSAIVPTGSRRRSCTFLTWVRSRDPRVAPEQSRGSPRCCTPTSPTTPTRCTPTTPGRCSSSTTAWSRYDLDHHEHGALAQPGDAAAAARPARRALRRRRTDSASGCSTWSTDQVDGSLIGARGRPPRHRRPAAAGPGRRPARPLAHPGDALEAESRAGPGRASGSRRHLRHDAATPARRSGTAGAGPAAARPAGRTRAGRADAWPRPRRARRATRPTWCALRAGVRHRAAPVPHRPPPRPGPAAAARRATAAPTSAHRGRLLRPGPPDPALQAAPGHHARGVRPERVNLRPRRLRKPAEERPRAAARAARRLRSPSPGRDTG